MRFSLQRVLLASCFVYAGATVASADIFEPLFTVSRVVGSAQIVRPGRAAEPLKVDHSYPYGSRILVPSEPVMTNGVPAAACEVVVELAHDFRFRLGQGADVSILDMTTGEGADLSEIKIVDVARGTVNTFITVSTQKSGGGAGDALVEKNLAAIIVRTPVGECTRLSQRNEIKVEPDPAAEGFYACTFATESGSMEIYGPQYSVKEMKKNAAVLIAGNKKQTAISTVNGECVVAFEKGADAEERALFKVRCIGKIWRQYADVGGKMAVAVMIYYPRGNTYELKSYNYLEGQTNVGMWTSVAAAVSGEHGKLAVPGEPGVGDAGDSEGGSDGSDSGWDSGSDDGDDGGWNPDDDDGGGDDGGGDGGGDDFDFGGNDGFDFGF